MRHLSCALVALTLLVSATTKVGASLVGSDCDQYSDCASCTSHKAAGGAGCGWCHSSSSCKFGKSSGPIFGTCSAWDWLSSTCAATTPVPPITPAPTPAPPAFRPVNPNAPAWNSIGGHGGRFFDNETLGSPLTPQVRWSHHLNNGGGDALYITKMSAGGGYVFSYKCSNDLGTVWFEALNASTGDLVKKKELGGISGSCQANPTAPVFDEAKQRVYVPDWQFGRPRTLSAFHVGGDWNKLWTYTLNGSYPGAPYTATPVPMLYHSASSDSLHFILRATKYVWVAVNASSGKQFYESSPFGSINGGGGVYDSFVSIGDLGDGNGEVLVASLHWELQVAAYYVKYQTVVWSGSLPMPAGQEWGSVSPLMAFPGTGFYVCYSYYPSGGGTNVVQCSMMTMHQGNLSIMWADLPRGGSVEQPATDGEFVLMRHYDNIKEMYATNGSLTGREYSSTSQGGHLRRAWHIAITPDYLFAFFTNSNAVECWNRHTQQIVPGFGSNLPANSYSDMILYGGWVFLTDGNHYYGVQVQAA